MCLKWKIYLHIFDEHDHEFYDIYLMVFYVMKDHQCCQLTKDAPKPRVQLIFVYKQATTIICCEFSSGSNLK